MLAAGVERVFFKASPTLLPTAGSVTGTFKQYYDRGTVSGTFSVAPTGAVTYAGNGTLDSGTGAYRGARGTITRLSCSSPDGGTHTR